MNFLIANPRTTAILKNSDGVYSITIPREGLDMETMMSDVVIPLLLATGYQRGSIDDYFTQAAALIEEKEEGFSFDS